MALAAALCVVAATGASGESVEFDLVAGAHVEAVTGQLTNEIPGDFFSPFLLINDVNAGTLVSVSGKSSLGNVRFGATYTFENAFFEENKAFNYEVHTVATFVSFDPTPSTQFWLQYTSENSLPDGQFGDIHLDVVSARMRLPKYEVGDLKTHLRPYVFFERETSDSVELREFTYVSVLSELGFQLIPQDGFWRSELFATYGVVDSDSIDFSFDFVKFGGILEVDFDDWWDSRLVQNVDGLLELSHDLQWYKGGGAPDGSPLFHENTEATLTVSKGLKSGISLDLIIEAADHQSNWAALDYFETKSRLVIKAGF